jgi:signal transduction histidine kinase
LIYCYYDHGQTVWTEGFVNGGAQLAYKAGARQRSLSPSVAHDLNNPLEVLGNLLYLVEAEPNLTENGRRCLKLAREEILRITHLVRDNLDEYHDTPRRQETIIPKLLDEIVELYKSRFEGSGIAVETRYRTDGCLSAFPQQLRRAFSNLLLNAADALPLGGTIKLRVCRAHEWSGEARRGLRVTFADNGSGITRDDLPRIFQPFFSTKGASGSGMGLAIVKDAVTQHGGGLRVRSTTRAGRSGSVFSIFLPAV